MYLSFLLKLKFKFCRLKKVIQAKLDEYRALQALPSSVAQPTSSSATTASSSSSNTVTTGAAATPGSSSTLPASSRGGEAAPQSSAPLAPLQPPRVNPRHLQQLFDMGFTREQGEEALLACGDNLTAAMDWLLSRPATSGAGVCSVGVVMGVACMHITLNSTLHSILWVWF